MQQDTVRNDMLINSIGQFLQSVLPTTPTPVSAPEVEAVPPSKIQVKEDVPEYGPTATPI
jgi:hypothetical protein